MLESELRGAMVFVDEFKARLQEWCGNKEGKAETDTAGDRTTEERARTPRKRSGGWSLLAVGEYLVNLDMSKS